jgi:hypothetical protein
MFDQEGDRAAELAADRKPLQQARDHYQDRRDEADCCIARRHHHDRRADHHERDRQSQTGLAAVAVGIGADQRRTQRPHHIGEAERAECYQQRNGRVACWKKHLGDRHRKIAVNQEIEPFEDVADRRRDHHAREGRSLRHSSAERCIGTHRFAFNRPDQVGSARSESCTEAFPSSASVGGIG